MSGSTAQSQLGERIRQQASSQSNQLGDTIAKNLAFLGTALGNKFGGDWNAIPGEVASGYDKVRAATEDAYRSASFSAAEETRYMARTSGENLSRGQIDSALASRARALDTDRRFALGQIQLEEANAGLSANNALMRLFTGAGQTALGLASTYQSQAAQAASMVPSSDPWAGALAGAASGAAAGSAIPGWGTAIGGVIGAIGGYLGSK